MMPDSTKPPIFVVCGMPRSGTTFIYHSLQSHPQVFVPYRKESYYFSVNFSKGEQWFTSLYEERAPHQLCADINPMYYLDPAAISRILEYKPGTKVILGIREPVDFIVSLYGNMIAHGLDVPRILETIRGYRWPLTPKTALTVDLPGDHTKRKVKEYRDAFGDNLMIYDYAEFKRISA